jgi:hypothetical protein
MLILVMGSLLHINYSNSAQLPGSGCAPRDRGNRGQAGERHQVKLLRVMGTGGCVGGPNGKPHRSRAGNRTDLPLTRLIADHPALSNQIAFTVGMLAAASTIKSSWAGAAQIVFTPAYAISVAIPIDAASVSDGNNQTAQSPIAAYRHGERGACRQRDSGSDQDWREQFIHSCPSSYKLREMAA